MGVGGLQRNPSCILGDPARGETDKSLSAGHLLNGRACSPVCAAMGTEGAEQVVGALSMGLRSLGVDVCWGKQGGQLELPGLAR